MNGIQLQNFSETLAMLTAQIYGVPEIHAAFLMKFPEDQYGQIEHVNEIILLAKKFEKANKGRDWDGEYYDAIDEFLASQLQ